MADFLFRSLVACVFVAALAGGSVFLREGTPRTARRAERPPAPENAKAWSPVEVKGAVDVLAFVRSDKPLDEESVRWFFRFMKPRGMEGLNCRFLPHPGVKNIEMGNPDGSKYYTGILRATILLETTPGFRMPSGFDPAAGGDMEEPPGPPLLEPAIVIEAKVTRRGLDLYWSTANMDSSACRVLFKIRNGGDKNLPFLFCCNETGIL